MRARPADEDLPVDDLDLEGDLADDWGMEDEEDEEDENLVTSKLQAPPETVQLPENVPENVRQRLTNMQDQLDQFASPESLSSFDSVGGGGGDAMKWVEVPLNDTLSLFVCQVPGAANRFQEMMRGSMEVTEENRAIFEAGDTIWPASVIMARWFCIQPPVVPLEGRKVLDLGCGLGIAGIVAAGLGAEVLLQDRDPACLRATLETAVKCEVGKSITTLRCDYRELPGKLMEKEPLAKFAQPDIFLGCDVLLSEENVEALTKILQIFLRSPTQVAYFMDPNTRPHRKMFMQYCESIGLETREDELVTWEPEWDNFLEYDREWVMRLVTVRRPG